MTPPRYVLDASALLALINREPGMEQVEPILSESCISSVNFSEVLAVILKTGVPAEKLQRALEGLIDVVDFSPAQAWKAAEFFAHTRPQGLSLGDRACLALGFHLQVPVITADRAWKDLDLPLEVILIR